MDENENYSETANSHHDKTSHCEKVVGLFLRLDFVGVFGGAERREMRRV